MDQEEAARTERKVKKAAQLLFFRRHNQPGVKGWELKKAVGDDYLEIIEVLNSIIRRLGLEVQRLGDDPEKEGKPDNDRFVVVLKEQLTEKASGLRIDEVAILSATLAYIISKQGRASRKSVEDFLADKFPRRRVNSALDRYIRQGYLNEDEKSLFIGWRTRAEVDSKTLMELILGS